MRLHHPVLLLVSALMLTQLASAQERFADIQQGTNMTLALAPDGETLVFSLLGRLWGLPAGGGGARPLTPVGENARHPRFSPDGRRLVYQRLVEGQWELWLLDLETQERSQLTGPPFNEREPDFSADGEAIVFASNRDGPYDLWQLALEGRSLTRLTAGPGDASFPSVSERGEIAYVRRFGNEWSLRALAPDGRSTELLSGRNQLAAPVWRPGGGVLVYTEQNGSAASTLMMLLMSDPPLVRPLTQGEDVFTSRPAWDSRAQYVYTSDGGIWRRGLGNVRRSSVPLFAGVPVPSARPPALVTTLDAPGPHPVAGITATTVSRDRGRTVFTALGDLWLIEADSAPRRLTDEAHAAVDPALMPDGSSVVFASDRGGAMDLWRIDIESGALARLTDSPGNAYGPAVSPGGGRIVYLETEGLGPWSPSALKVLYLDLAPHAAETVVDGLIEPGTPAWSDDGRRILLEAARMGPDERAGPRAVLEIDFGTAPPGVLERRYAEVPERPSAPEVALAWYPAAPQVPYVVQAGRLFDGLSVTYRHDVDIHVEGQRIRAIVDRGAEPLPERVIDARDATIIPGLIDAHAHHSRLAGERLGRTWLAYGVTTVRELGGNLAEALERGEAWASGRIPGPRLVVTPWHEESAGEPGHVFNGSPAAALLHGHPGLPDGLGHTLVRQTRTLGTPQWREPQLLAKLVPANGTGVLQALEFSPLKTTYEDMVSTLVSSGTVLTTALGALGGLHALPPAANGLKQDPAYLRLFDLRERERWTAAGQAETSLNGLQDTVARLVRHGGRVATGSDAPAVPYGLGLHAELALLAAAGLSNYQVLRAATAEGAFALGLDRQLGTLEAGKLADFVVLTGDPLERIEDTLSIMAVVRGGLWLDREQLIAGPSRD